jgi:hypothetical protein
LIGSVAHLLDYCWQEEGERVNGAKTSHADEHVDVDFPVFDCLQNVFEGESIGEVSVIDSQPAFDFFTLVFGKELGSVGGFLLASFIKVS